VAASGDPTPTIAVSGSLPSGVSFNTSTKILSGQPLNRGTYTFDFVATNSEGVTTQEFTLIVKKGWRFIFG
jgi:hypothetical protein